MRRVMLVAASVLVLSIGLGAQNGSGGGLSSISSAALKEWLGYIASDELQGREVYTEGLGLAASYIADHLKEWGVKPAAEDGDYFQTVKVLGVKTTSRSTVTVDVNGRTRTFKDGEGITLPRNMGAKQVLTGDDVRFVGYGLDIPSAGLDDYSDTQATGRVIVWLGSAGPRRAAGDTRLLFARNRLAIDKGASAVIGPPLFLRGGRAQPAPAQPGPPGPATPPAAGERGAAAAEAAASDQTGRGGQRGRGSASAQASVDFTTAQRFDVPIAPTVTAQEEFFEFLFSGSKIPYAELKALADKREPLPHFALQGVKITFDIAPEYTIVSTRLTRNVVGIIEGSDPRLKDTYVAFGAHYDHIGYRTAPTGRGSGASVSWCPGQTRPEPRPDDVINNGADDDGSGTVTLMAVARAFALGPKPKRSLLFVWHTAEESGLQGSRYNADHPVVPNEQVMAQLNVDMVGRNRCDDPSEANTVYLVGSDRISTELHNVSEEANGALPKPLHLDYEMNDPADPESIYTRSDHYSYASKGIPIIFYTTGLHRDYHYLTDEVDKIEFDKMAHIAQLVYATGRRVANLDHPPARDNKGPRVGKGQGGRIR